MQTLTLTRAVVPGAQGYSVLSAFPARNPVPADGRDGDFWLNQDTTLLFRKTAGTWVPLFKLRGIKGDKGLQGPRGLSVLHGEGAPNDENIGRDGEWYIDEDTLDIYGPKIDGEWGDPRPLLKIMSGTGAPSNALGVNGQYYFDGDAKTMYGPKAAGTWPAGVSLLGTHPWGTPAPWVTATVYDASPPADAVTYGGETYVCAVHHTAGTFATDLAAGKWVKIAAKGTDAAIGTSTTSLTIGTGAKTLTVVTGNAFAPGQPVVIANTPAPANRMFGMVTAFNVGTGQLTVAVDKAEGAGTFTAWTASVIGKAGTDGSSVDAIVFAIALGS